jgi:cytochrome P450
MNALTFRPPRPAPRSALVSLMRAAMSGCGNLLDLMPASAYQTEIGPLGWSRRTTVVVNRPDLVRHVLTDPDGIFPKSDLMVNALEPLIGNSIFVSSGKVWRRQRDMLDPSLSMMRVNRAFPAITQGVAACIADLETHARAKRAFSLDQTMSHLTADIICRTVFSTNLEQKASHEVFEAFTHFERSVAQVEIRRLIMDKAWTKIPQKQDVLDACKLIRGHLADMLAGHLGEDGARFDDIARQVALARGVDGEGFTHEELIDQLGVLFLAGHETSASALTWVFYLLAKQPAVVARLREEVTELCGDGPIEFDHIKKLNFTRNVFRETIRLYPPITFLPRVALEPVELGGMKLPRGALVMVCPWLLHRHQRYWKNPDMFDPDRFLPEREGEMTSGAYIPFGLGPRVCAGAAFATVEAVLIIAELARRFDFALAGVDRVQPAARLTTRPLEQVMLLARRAVA